MYHLSHKPDTIFIPPYSQSQKNGLRKKIKTGSLNCLSLNTFSKLHKNSVVKSGTAPASVLLPSHSGFSLAANDVDLPDLSDSNSLSDYNDCPPTPTKPPCGLPLEATDQSDIERLSEIELLCIQVNPDELPLLFEVCSKTQTSCGRQSSVFEVPELVHRILYFAAIQTLVPDLSRAAEPGTEFLSCSKVRTLNDSLMYARKNGGVLFSCLLVNKLFYAIAKDLITEHLKFENPLHFESFATREEQVLTIVKPTTFELNRMLYAKQQPLDLIAKSIDSSRLQKLKFFMCPKLMPPLSFFTSSLISFTVAGSKVVDDSLLMHLGRNCLNLKHLDLRACDHVTDAGIYAIAQSCKKLVTLNLGRKRKGHLITDNSVAFLVRNNTMLETVGLAGCSISDISMWELALKCGANLRRLSINDCVNISNNSISHILNHGMLPHLCVLEIKDVPKLDDYAPIVNFKRHQALKGITLFIKSNKLADARLKECERRIDLLVSKLIYKDLTEWLHGKDDDIPFLDLLERREKRQ